MTTQNSYNRDGSQESRCVTTYDDQGKAITEEYESFESDYYYYHEYRYEGDVTITINYDRSGKETYRQGEERTENGLIIEYSYDSAGNVDYIYVYDNNWSELLSMYDVSQPVLDAIRNMPLEMVKDLASNLESVSYYASEMSEKDVQILLADGPPDIRLAAQQHTVKDGGVGQLILLCHIGYGLCQFITAHLKGIFAVNVQRAGFWLADAIEAGHKGAFAGTVVSQQAHHFAFFSGKTYALQNVCIGVRKGDIFDFNHFRFPPLTIRYRNSGAPRKEVSAPMGSTVGATRMRETISDSRSNTLPHRALQGMRKR